MVTRKTKAPVKKKVVVPRKAKPVEKETVSVHAWPFDLDTVEPYAFFEMALTEEECEEVIKIASKSDKLFNASVGGGQQGRVDKNIRISKINFISLGDLPCAPKIASMVFELNQKFFGFDLWGFAEGLQYTEYHAPDGNYDKHIDKVYQGKVRKLSMVIQLSDPSEYEGGDLNLYEGKNPITIKKQKGHLVVFPSYTLHEVTPVTKGTRRTLVAWLTGKPFK